MCQSKVWESHGQSLVSPIGQTGDCRVPLTPWAVIRQGLWVSPVRPIGQAVIPTPVWSPSTVAYPLVDALHFLHWDQSFIGSNFHWDRIHWDQDYSGMKFHWDRISIGIEFIGSKFHWEQFRWEQTSMGLKRSAHAMLSLLSQWLATTGTTA